MCMLLVTDRQTDMEGGWQTRSQHDECEDQLASHSSSSISSRSEVKCRVCAGCQRAIRERHYLSAVDCYWHSACLVCSVCHVTLDSQPTCYFKDARIYCKHDYFRSAYQQVDITTEHASFNRICQVAPISDPSNTLFLGQYQFITPQKATRLVHGSWS